MTRKALLSFVLVSVSCIASAKAEESNVNKNPPQPTINENVTSHNQSGGITAHTVTIAPPRRSLSDSNMDALKRQILAELPKDKPITVIGVLGDPESCQFAEEIHAFMKANGFSMKEPGGISQSVFTPTAQGLIVQPEGDGLKFIVGSR